MEIVNFQSVESSSSVAHCKNCGIELQGKFCSDCGQKHITERITVRRIFSELFASLTNLEKGFWYTFKMLIINPGAVVREFIQGNTVRYYSPLRYLLLWITISVGLSLFTGLYDQQQATMQEMTGYSQKEEVAAKQREAQQQIQTEVRKYLTFIPLLILPFMGLASYWVFRRRGQNYAEHLVLNAFAYGQTTAIGIPVMLLILVFPALLPYLFFKIILLSVAYYAYLYRSFFRIRIGGAIVKALFTNVLAYFFAFFFFGVVGLVAGIIIAIKSKGG